MLKRMKVLAILLCAALLLTTFNVTSFVVPGTINRVEAAVTWDTYSDSWTATDELGRTLSTYENVGPVRTDRYVGMFYHLWHHDVMYNDGSGNPGAPNDIFQILTSNPANLNNSNSPPWGPVGNYHYWGKPLMGYYDPEVDEYALRRHAQMLSDAGVDTLIFDFTNYWASGVENPAYYNWNAFVKLADTFTSIRNAGGNTPQFVFMCTWNGQNSANGVTKLYNDIYSQNKYSDLWFRWEGKPLIIADKTNCSSTIQNFFTFRKGHPQYTAPDEANDWPWNAIYPQSPAYTASNATEAVAVGVAQNWSTGLTFMSGRNANGQFVSRGRSYTSATGEPLYTDPMSASYPKGEGRNFAEGLGKAIEIDPNFLFITAWNEWVATRFNNMPDWTVGDSFPAGGNFCDVYTPEFSRDIEPTLDGGLGDNYYMQIASAIRKYKGVRAPASASGAATITIDGSFSDWTSVNPEFRDDIGDKASRNCTGIGNSVTYTNTTGRNDYKLMKVARDASNIYFYVETIDNITSYTDLNWMRLFIKTGTGSNWKGYNYVVNRTGVGSTTTTLEKCNGGWSWSTQNSNISYRITGNKMELRIPRSDLGLTGTVDFQFKLHDNMQTQGDVYEFYTNGDAAPNERYNYCYTESAPTATFARNTYTGVGSAYALQVTGTQTPAMKFTADYTFDGVETSCPSYGNNTGNLTMILYKWNTDYNTTVVGNPIATNTFSNFADNAWLKLSFTKQAPGEYLWVLNNPVETVGIWKYESSNNTAVSYLNGTATAGDFVSRIDYKIDSNYAEVNDNDSRISYSSMNYLNTASGYISTDCHYSNISNAYTQFTFTGTSVQWIGAKNTDHGIANVYIDGVLDSTVDTYGTNAKQQVLYTKSGLSNGSHTIKIVVTNTKNASSSGYYQDIDAFRYK